jgi:hypothetical protein
MDSLDFCNIIWDKQNLRVSDKTYSSRGIDTLILSASPIGIEISTKTTILENEASSATPKWTAWFSPKSCGINRTFEFQTKPIVAEA